MDVSFTMQNAKSLKLGLDRNFGEGKSRICSLPDSILHQILSFLDIKEAVRTSVLSKRWEFLWASLPKLKFKENLKQSDEKREEFMNFVEKALLLHDTSSIHTFSLTCKVPSDGIAPRINSWIHALLWRKVQKMRLGLHFNYYHGSFMLSRHLFACESLKELELDFSYDLKLPSFVYFPDLKILTLSRVFFMDDNSVKQLFSSCPKLEKLDLVDCNWGNVKAVCVAGPMLEYLKIFESCAIEDAGPNFCQFMISGPRLQYFHFAGNLVHEYCISMVPSLVDADVDVRRRNIVEDRRAAYRAYKLLGGLANVKNLRLLSYTPHAFTAAEELIPCLPLFHNLNHLQFRCEVVNVDCRFLLKMLHNAPHLESIYFAAGLLLDLFYHLDGCQLDPFPPCFLTHLKTIKFEGFCGYLEELDMLKSMVKSAGVLERSDLGCEEKNRNHNVILDLLKDCLKSNVVLH